MTVDLSCRPSLQPFGLSSLDLSPEPLQARGSFFTNLDRLVSTHSAVSSRCPRGRICGSPI